ncbi:MAG: ComF family protein [Phycisphaeraceae bacterium]|nr:ComF family protein [Phycisphaeraceae bacterium]MCB9848137.1 ComF family protein [Phycisphaeraceae bacterium]
MNRPGDEFVWPPADAAPAPAPIGIQAPPSQPIVVAPRAGWWRSIERAWLCPIAEPVADRLIGAGWTREAPGACCDRCATTVGVGEADEFGCASCRDRRVPWDRAFRLGVYEGELREIILEVKFTRFRSAGVALGRLLGGVIRDSGAPVGDLVVVPVPMSARRRLARGIDHASAIAHGASRELQAPMQTALRRAHRPSQRSVSLGARARNVAGTMRLRRGAETGLRGRVVLLVDDVRTSGATLGTAARAIRGDGAGQGPLAVWVATVGVTPGRSVSELAGLGKRRRDVAEKGV